MAKPNYSYEKRQRELAKKRKKEEKAQRKTHGRPDEPEGAGEAGVGPDTAQAETLEPVGAAPGAAGQPS